MMEYVRIFDDVFELDTLCYLLKYLNKIKFTPALISNEYKSNVVDKNVILIAQMTLCLMFFGQIILKKNLMSYTVCIKEILKLVK